MEKYHRIRRIAAWAGIIILTGIFLATFILGVAGNEDTKDLFTACVVCSVLVPVLFYAIFLVARAASRRGQNGQQDEQKNAKETLI